MYCISTLLLYPFTQIYIVPNKIPIQFTGYIFPKLTSYIKSTSWTWLLYKVSKTPYSLKFNNFFFFQPFFRFFNNFLVFLFYTTTNILNLHFKIQNFTPFSTFCTVWLIFSKPPLYLNTTSQKVTLILSIHISNTVPSNSKEFAEFWYFST